jgi:CTP:molybdopterin cytidylyltransferase MocA
METTGLLLAAGAGTRAGGPKALRAGWIEHACESMLSGGCVRVIVVLGAATEAPLPADSRVSSVIAPDWADGMSRSIVAGLAAVGGRTPPGAQLDESDGVLVSLVDLPGLPLAVVERVLDGYGALRQAVFEGRPGHPVYIGAAHWDSVAQSVSGDSGARDYLVRNGANEIECGDVWHGRDVDGPPSV